MAAVKFRCPSCGQKLAAGTADLHKHVRCQRCGERFRPVDIIDKDVAVPVVDVDDAPDSDEELAAELSDAAEEEGLDASEERGPEPRPKELTSKQKTLLYGRSPSKPKVELAPPRPPPAKSEKAGEPDRGQGATVVMDKKAQRARARRPAATPGPEAGSAPTSVEAPPPSEPEDSPEPPPDSSPPAEPAADVSDKQVTQLFVRRKPLPPLVQRLQAAAPRPRKNTTTLFELSGVAEQLVAQTNKRMRLNWVMAGLATVAPLLVLATALIQSGWRWVPGALAALCVLGLLAWGALRLLPRVAERLGPRVLPGRAAWWLGGGAGALAAAAGLITWGASAATQPLVAASLPDAPVPGLPVQASEPPAVDGGEEPLKHVRAAPGVLYIPKTFHTDDGSFDLLLHFHGNTKLVEKSVAEAGLNALVHITNLGVTSDPYERHFVVPDAFDDMLGRIEKKAGELGIENAKIKRIAVTSWSAGYGAVYRILQSKENAERIEALMLLDGLHLGYIDPKERVVDERHLRPFVNFAEAAAAGKKLFILTHSDVNTHGYAPTRLSADIILSQLGGTRGPADPERDSPPRVEFEEARKALPAKFDEWLQAKTVCDLGSFHVWGYTGKTPEHHMAHLVQMSVTVLPKLVELWQ